MRATKLERTLRRTRKIVQRAACSVQAGEAYQAQGTTQWDPLPPPESPDPRQPFVLLSTGPRRRVWGRPDRLIVACRIVETVLGAGAGCWEEKEPTSRSSTQQQHPAPSLSLEVRVTRAGQFPTAADVSLVRAWLTEVAGEPVTVSGDTTWPPGTYRLLPIGEPGRCYTVVVPLGEVEADVMGAW